MPLLLYLVLRHLPPTSLPLTAIRAPYQAEFHDCIIEEEKPPGQVPRAPPDHLSTSPSSMTAEVELEELVEARVEGWGALRSGFE